MASQNPPQLSGIRTNAIHVESPDAHVFLTESGAIGMEYGGRIAVRTIEKWVALAFGDMKGVAR